METPRSDMKVYRRRARTEVGGDTEATVSPSTPFSPRTPAEPKLVNVYRRGQRMHCSLGADIADSAAINIYGETMEVSETCSPALSSPGKEGLEISAANDVPLRGGVSFTQLLSSSSTAKNDNQEEGANKEDATSGTDKSNHSRNVGRSSRVDPFAPSTPSRKKPKKKKHAPPKIATGKPMRTPKAKIRADGSSTGKRKSVSKNAVEGSSTPLLEESEKKIARRKSLVDTPITPVEDAAAKGIGRPSAESVKRCLTFDDESQEIKVNLSPGPLIPQPQVQTRMIRRSKCLIRSKGIEPSFPETCKQRRSKRQWKEVPVLLQCLRRTFKKKKRSTRTCRADVSGLWTFVPKIIRKKQRRLTPKISSERWQKNKVVNVEGTQAAAEVKSMKNESAHVAEEGCLDCLSVPFCSMMLNTPPKQAPKGRVKQLPKKELVDFIRRLMCLNINDAAGALVPYKPKQKPPKVLLDAETMRAWNRLMLLEDAGGGSGETDRQREESWEKERNEFQERVKNFTDHMHVILGDRSFTPWKGSVVDSVVGVFLTQNVSDFLSSSAFMSLWAKFPVKSENKAQEDAKVDECSLQFESSAGSVGSTYNAAVKGVQWIGTDLNEGIRTKPSSLENWHSGVTEEKRCVHDMPPISTVSSNFDDSSSPLSENQLEGEDSSLYLPPHHFSQESSSNPEFLIEEIPLHHLSQESSSNPEFVIEEMGTEDVKDEIQNFNQETVQEEPIFGGITKENPIQIEPETSASRENKKGVSQKENKKVDPAEWERLRRMYSTDGPRNKDHMDSVDWEAVRCAKPEEVAETIRERGQHNNIAARIQEFLERILSLHKSIDLEWLRNCPPDKVKEYLLEVNGLGLKSVECIRLLCLQHRAFPVDINVGRIAIRLGWVPLLEPLPDNLKLHLLENYPLMDEIQKYLWPRLCTLDQQSLYELHYHLITFGKVFCTKRSPSCHECPLRGDCKHYASAFASALPLPAPQDESIVTSVVPISSDTTTSLIHEAASLLESNNVASNCEPIVEVPMTPEPETCHSPLRDIEDLCLDNDDEDEIPTIRLNSSQFMANLRSFMDGDMLIQNKSNALVALTSAAASLPLPKLKYVSRLRTEHGVYVLPDNHPILASFEKRDPDDPCPYLLAIWPTDSSLSSETRCTLETSGEICKDERCSHCYACGDRNPETIKGTILIPCRTAMRGSFPLNGTYFQVNEVLADDESSQYPIDVPRDLIWNLRRRIAYFGTSTSTILRGLSAEKIQFCFWRGFVCVRGFDRKTRAARPLALRFHRSTSVSKATKGEAADKTDR